MSDDDFDAWGNEETDWFANGSDDSLDEGDGGVSAAPLGAQHIMVLVDSSEDMYVPCIPVDDTVKQKRMAMAFSNGSPPQQPKQEEEQKLLTPMDVALKACEGFLRRRLRKSVTRKTGTRDGFGLMMYGTRHRPPIVRNNNNQADTKNDDPHHRDSDQESEEEDDEESGSDTSVHRRSASRFGAATTAHMLIPMEPPGLDAVQTLRHCLVEHPVHGRRIDLHEDYGHDKDNDSSKRTGNPLHTAFHDARKIFKEAKCVKKNTNKPDEPQQSKILWIFTNRDLPFDPSTNKTDDIKDDDDDDEDEKETEQDALALVHTLARDLIEGGFTLMVWPLKHPTKTAFQRNLFYDQFCTNPRILDHCEDHDEEMMDVKEKQPHEDMMDLTQLMDAMVASFKKWRRTIYVPLLLPDFLDFYKRQPETKTEPQQKKEQPAETSSDENNDDPEQQEEAEPEPYPGIMLDFFNMALIQKKPTRTMVHRRTGVELDKFESVINQEDGEMIVKRKMTNVTVAEREQYQQQEGWKRLRQFAKLGDELVPLSKEDVAELKMRCNANQFFASLILLGFKKPEDIPFHHNMEKSWFVYPNDDYNDLTAPNACSSTEAFANLHAAMRRKNVVGIGELLTRKTTTSRLVAIHAIAPPELQEDEYPQIQHKIPAGMVVVQLPFEDETRALEPDPAAERLAEERQENDDGGNQSNTNDGELLEIPPVLSDAVQELVEQQTLPDGIIWAEDFKNASLEYYWDSLEYGALGEQLPSDNKYMIAEAIDGQDLRETLGEFIDNVQDALPEEPPEVKKTKKRPAITVVDDTNIDWQTYYDNDELSELKNDDLKTKLASLGLKKGGKKAELVERLKAAFESQMPNGGGN